MTALLKYDAACRAIAEAKSIDEVQDWIDKAAAVREYTRRIGNRQLEIDAIEIRVRARRRRGEILLQPEEEGLLRKGRKEKVTEQGPLNRVTLEDLGISKNDSSEDQKIARMEGNSFERLLARCRAYAEAHPEKHSFDVLKPPPEGGPVNGARAVMGSRREPDDSLDYFPTPPWATRALVERVFPQLGLHGGDCRRLVAWEPACGEGHIAEALKEYFGTVTATDIFDYGYGLGGADFLSPDIDVPADWIITNPPFGEKAEQFVLRALQLARHGVAMFLRLQWLETIGRYEEIFAPYPPAVIAQFAERVPLHKGRWEPGGTTATAYLWIVWLKGRSDHTRFFWIPPGCRDVLSKPDDVERFTAHPVTPRPTDAAGQPLSFDASTGEISDDGAHPVDADGPVDGNGADRAGDLDGGSADREGPRLTDAPLPDRPDASDHPDSLQAQAPMAKAEEDDLLFIPEFLRRKADNSLPDSNVVGLPEEVPFG